MIGMCGFTSPYMAITRALSFFFGTDRVSQANYGASTGKFGKGRYGFGIHLFQQDPAKVCRSRRIGVIPGTIPELFRA